MELSSFFQNSREAAVLNNNNQSAVPHNLDDNSVSVWGCSDARRTKKPKNNLYLHRAAIFILSLRSSEFLWAKGAFLLPLTDKMTEEERSKEQMERPVCLFHQKPIKCDG